MAPKQFTLDIYTAHSENGKYICKLSAKYKYICE